MEVADRAPRGTERGEDLGGCPARLGLSLQGGNCGGVRRGGGRAIEVERGGRASEERVGRTIGGGESIGFA